MKARTNRAGEDQLVVSPKRACVLLDCSMPELYKLLNAGELESFRIGVARKILMRSIHAFIERRLAEARKQAA